MTQVYNLHCRVQPLDTWLLFGLNRKVIDTILVVILLRALFPLFYINVF